MADRLARGRTPKARMNGYRVIGIDPALTNVGLVVLENSRPGQYEVVGRGLIKPRTNWPILQRLNAIREGLGQFIGDAKQVYRELDAIVVENATSRAGPTYRIGGGKGKNNPVTVAAMSLAVGVAVSVALDYHHSVAFIDVDEWMPRERGHIMAKPMMVRSLLGLIKAPPLCSEHELMAAGVARYWIEKQRMAERIKKATA